MALILDGLSECKGSNFRHFIMRADIQLFLTSTKNDPI